MTRKEIELIDLLNFANREWHIIPAIEIETDLFFGSTTNEIIEGPIIYSYIKTEMICYYAKIASDTIGSDRFKIIETEFENEAIAIYTITETEE